MKLICFNHVNVNYESTCALKDVNLVINKGDYIIISGPNGGGKTTLLKLILGMIKPFSGEFYMKRNIKIGYVPQHTLFDRSFPIKVEDVAMMGMLNKPKKYYHRFAEKEVKEAEEVMERFGILNIREVQIHSLSGGQLQKVLFARAVLTNPDLLVLDEPTSNLDSESKNMMNTYLDKMSKEVTIVKVTHEEHASGFVNKMVYVSQNVKVVEMDGK